MFASTSIRLRPSISISLYLYLSLSVLIYPRLSLFISLYQSAELFRLNETRQETDKELNDLRKEVADCQVKLDAKDWRITDLEGELQAHFSKETEWETTYQQLEAEKSTILESQVDVETKTSELKASYEEMEKTLKKENQEKCVKVTTLEAQLQSMEKQKESLRKELHDTKEALRLSKHGFSELQKDYIDHQKNCEGFRQEVGYETLDVFTRQTGPQSQR